MAKPTAILTQHILSQIVDLVDLPVLLLDASTDSLSVVLANPACQELLRDLCGKHDNLVLAELLDDGTPSPDPTQIVTELEGGREMRLRLRAGEGGAMAAPMLRLLPLRDKTGSTTHALGLIEAAVAPVGQRRMRDAAEAANTVETAVDRVTGLLLPSSFTAKFSASWETACENASKRFMKLTGELPPCEPLCPCAATWKSAEFFPGNVDFAECFVEMGEGFTLVSLTVFDEVEGEMASATLHIDDMPGGGQNSVGCFAIREPDDPESPLNGGFDMNNYFVPEPLLFDRQQNQIFEACEAEFNALVEKLDVECVTFE